MNTQELLSCLRGNEIFQGFSKEELELILPLLTVTTFKEREVIVKEGEDAHNLYIIVKGRVEVFKEEKDRSFSLAMLHEGEWFGEMALFENFKRFASVRALEQTEVIAISITSLDLLSKEQIAYSKIVTNLLKKMSNRLRCANDNVVKVLKEDLKRTKIHDQIGEYIIHVFIFLIIYFYASKVILEYAADALLLRIMSAGLVILFTGIAISLVKRSGYPLSYYGLTLKNFGRNTLEGILFSLPVLAIQLVGKWAFVTFDPALQGQPIFGLGLQQAHREEALLLAGVYTLLIPVQEFIARGCLQKPLQEFFRSPHRKFQAIFASNLLFGLVHSIQTFTFALVAFTLGLLWGWIFARQQSIVGPTVSHILIASWGLLALNYQTIFIH